MTAPTGTCPGCDTCTPLRRTTGKVRAHDLILSGGVSRLRPGPEGGCEVSAFSGNRSLAALAPSLVPSGRGTDAAVRGMLAALAAVTAMVTTPGTEARQQFNQAVTIARAHNDDAYSRAFMNTAWLAIDELRDATEGTY